MNITLIEMPVRNVFDDYNNKQENGITDYGGKTTADNCQMLCKPCNRRK